MKTVKKSVPVIAVLLLAVAVMAVNVEAAVPDKLECDAQPSVIHATQDPEYPSMTEVTAGLFTEDGQPVKMCGIEIKCESQNPDILHNGQGGAILTATTDSEGKATFDFESTSDRPANLGKVDVICRSLQQESCTAEVEVRERVPGRVEVTACPYAGEQKPDILADGKSKVVIAAQLKDRSWVPVKKSGVQVKFVSPRTNILKECDGDVDGDGLDIIKGYTNSQGVAYAEFCSAGKGSENEGSVDISVQPDGGFDINSEVITIETTLNSGTTTISGQLSMSMMPSQIMADKESTMQACIQLRKKDGHIMKNPPENVVSLVSHNISKLIPVDQEYPATNPGYTAVEENGNFPQGGVYTAEFKSAGIYNPNSVGDARIEASAEFFSGTDGTVELKGSQMWPERMNVVPSLDVVGCDGTSTTKITVQLLDAKRYPVWMEGRQVVFESQHPELLVDADDGDAIAKATTNKFGIAHAIFRAKDCKMDNVDGGRASVVVSSISDSISATERIYVRELDGYKPDGVNVYTDQTALGYNSDNPAHAAPALIAADGKKPVRVTAQVCEKEDYLNKEVKTADGAVITMEDVGDAVKWTIDVDENAVDYGAYALVIGDGNNIEYQIHSNDGVDPSYSVGTHLYSDYDGGWSTATDNTPVSSLGWVSATGKRQFSENPDGLFTVTIRKNRLDLNDGELKWAVSLHSHGTYAKTPSGFTWYDETTENMHESLIEKFCNPVKREGIRLEFKVKNDNIVMNKDHDGPEDGIDYVYLETDKEGKATATFRSTGTTPNTNEGCTNIKVTAQDGSILGNAYAKVCSVQHEGEAPNVVWKWAQPAFITADGTSKTTVRAALYWCDGTAREYIEDYNAELNQESKPLEVMAEHCKPVQLPGAQVKFETMDTQIVDDGKDGKIIYDTTDEYGQAQATFSSAGFQEQNIGAAEIKVFVDHIGEDVIQANKLYVTTEEKTWPWCPPEKDWLTGGAAEADLDDNQFISDNELLKYVLKWFEGTVNDSKLIEAITVWAAQL